MSDPTEVMYELSVGWGPGKTWFMVDASPFMATHRSVETKTINGELREIVVKAPFSYRPVLADLIRVVQEETYADHAPEIYEAIVGLETGGESP